MSNPFSRPKSSPALLLKFTHGLVPKLAVLFGLIFSPEALWAACGEILVSKGDIKVESGAGGKISNAPQGTKVCQGDTVIAGAQSRAKVKMEDGNELNISPDSRIKLEVYEYKPADNKKKVMLNVLYGKVRSATREENMYNDSAKDGQANTFQVKTKSAVAGVRGTDFLTSFDRQTSKTEVVTFKGNVDVGRAGPGGTILGAVSIGAGQKTEALPGAPPAPPKPVPAKDMEKMNVESSADMAGVKKEAPTRDSGAGSASGSAANAGDGGKKNTMLDPGDLGTAPDRSPAAVPSGPPTFGPPAPIPTPPPIPSSELVRQQLETGPAKVNLKIVVPQ